MWADTATNSRTAASRPRKLQARLTLIIASSSKVLFQEKYLVYWFYWFIYLKQVLSGFLLLLWLQKGREGSFDKKLFMQL